MENKIEYIQYGIAIIIPVVTLVISIYFKTHLPKKKNLLYGYRTSSSFRNQDTWDEANQYSSKLLVKLSIITLGIELLIMMSAKYLADLIDNETLYLGALYSPIIVFILVIPFTEIHLGKIFTKEGIRKSN